MGTRCRYKLLSTIKDLVLINSPFIFRGWNKERRFGTLWVPLPVELRLFIDNYVGVWVMFYVMACV